MVTVILRFDDDAEAQKLRDAIIYKGYVIVPLKHSIHGWKHVNSGKLYPQLEQGKDD